MLWWNHQPPGALSMLEFIIAQLSFAIAALGFTAVLIRVGGP
jgi:hypothetical protein